MDELARTLRRVLEGEGVELAYLIGSEARGQASAGSDVDIAVLPRRPLSLLELGALAERLERELGGRRVDLVDLHRAPPLLLAEVRRDGQVLVERDPAVRFDFETRALQRALDTRPLRAAQQALLRERALLGRSG